jgi:hypothetical protein
MNHWKLNALAGTTAEENVVNGIQQGIGIHSAPTSSAVSQERRGELPHMATPHAQATLLTLTSAASGDHAQAQPGLIGLCSLLRELQSAELNALPPRTAQLLAELGRHLLPASELGNTGRVRNNVLASGLFLDADTAQVDASDSEGPGQGMPLDLKSLLAQLLALMQPGRQLTMRSGNLQFISLFPGTAQCLQAYADEQKQGSRHKQFQARLLGNVETAFVGIVRNQLQSLNQSSEKKTTCWSGLRPARSPSR